MSDFSILYEDDEILLVNKPWGTAVQGGQGVAHPLDQELAKQLGYKIHLVHRLDKDTAGILVVAKNAKAASRWTALIAGDSVKKEYAAICLGYPVLKGKRASSGCIKGSVEAHGRVQSAETFFKVVNSRKVSIPASQNTPEDAQVVSEEVELSLLRITLGTGRMHQIRIQMAGAGCPLAADDQHGNFKMNKKIRRLGIKKLCLAAVKLTVPLNGESRTFEIPLPSHMQEAVDKYLS